MSNVFLWLDLETSGLDVFNAEILEVACIFEGSRYTRTVRFRGKIENDFVRNMHTNSKLLKACLKAADIEGVEEDLVAWIQERAPSGADIVLAGNSIHFDRDFLKIHMPLLYKILHYRMLDVTSIAFFAKALNIPEFEKKKAHRALPDLEESLAEYRYYHKIFEDLEGCGRGISP